MRFIPVSAATRRSSFTSRPRLTGVPSTTVRTPCSLARVSWAAAIFTTVSSS